MRLETLDGERILAVHGGVPAEKDGSLSEAFRGLSGNALFAALEGGLAGNDTEAFNALVYDTMGSHDGSSKKNPVWFLGREYVDMGRKAFDAFLRNAETDVVVVGHDNQVPASFYDGKLRGLDACGRIRKESAMLTGKPGEKSDIFLFL